MTIDEAILLERETVRRNKMMLELDKLMQESHAVCFDKLKREKSIRIHQQLAEWLEELKSYRASVFSGDMTQKMLKEEYNKAINDLLYKMLEKGIIDLYQYNEMRYFAEQLKAGGENDNLRR